MIPDTNFILSLVSDLNTLPLETRWLLRGIQIGMKLSEEVAVSKTEELARAGLAPTYPH